MTTSEHILELAVENIKMFETRLVAHKMGSPGIRPHECKMYLGIWQAIHAKGGQWDKLNGHERLEVKDALADKGMRINPRGEISKLN